MSTRATLVAALLAAASSAAFGAPDPDDVFKRAAKAGDKAAMIAAAEQLGAAPTDDGVEVLIKYGALIEDVEVYVACRNALASATEGDAREELVKGLEKSRRVEQRVLCADALARADDEGAAAALAEALGDRELPVRVAAIRGLSNLKRRSCIDPLIEHLGKLDLEHVTAEAEETYEALRLLTGQVIEAPDDWKKWVSTLPADFDPKSVGTHADASTRQRENSGKIFDSEVRSARFVLALDISSSMRVIDLPPGETWTDGDGKSHAYEDPGVDWPPDPTSRFARAREEFVQFIRNLPPHVQFTIVVFGEGKDTRAWQERLVGASPRAKQQAIGFVEQLKWSGATRTDLALERCFAVPDADTIYMFSDGIPERLQGGKTERIPQEEVLEKARTLNRVRKMRLNVYGFATVSGSTRAFLQQLARANDGEYKDIR